MSVALISKLPGIEELRHDDTGIYFLVAEEEVIYVGQSMSVARRATSHMGKFPFDRIFWMRVAPDMLDATESAFIRFLDPRENRGAPLASTALDNHILSTYGLCASDGTSLPGIEAPTGRRFHSWKKEWVRMWMHLGARILLDARKSLADIDLMSMPIESFVELFRDKGIERLNNLTKAHHPDSRLMTVGDIVRCTPHRLNLYKDVGSKTLKRWHELSSELGLVSRP